MAPELARPRTPETTEPIRLAIRHWNLNPSWKMRWANPPAAINFSFEVVRAINRRVYGIGRRYGTVSVSDLDIYQ